MSFAHALEIAEALHKRVASAPSNPKYLATAPAEISEGKVAREKFQEALGSTIDLVEHALSLVSAKESKAPTPRAPSTASKPSTLDDIHATKLEADFLASSTTESDAKKVIDGMNADSTKKSCQALESMAKAIEPVIPKFNAILAQPYLKEHHANLNTVPVVGVKNNQLLYIQTQYTAGKLVDGWSVFSSLPPGIAVNSGDVVHIFPYKGDFCFSSGKTVWKKTHLSDKDPSIANAVDNWPALYSRDWTPLGECLPSANLAGLVPFAVLRADQEAIQFHLVSLSVEGALSYLTNDQLKPDSTWKALTYGGTEDLPKFTKIAYWSNTVVGIDDASNTWNITIDFSKETYKVDSSSEIEPVTEYTATEAGLVGLRSDGYLWKRIIAPSPDDEAKDTELQWAQWIKADGVVNLGVASPGVLLDLDVLTRSLQSRYVQVQTAIYPVVEKIRAYCITHGFFLGQALSDVEAYNASNNNKKKQALAMKNARAFIAHAKAWGPLVSKAIASCQGPVTAMTAQLHDIRLQLEAQLKELRDKLESLKATLKGQEQAMSNLNATFWGVVAGAFVGLALAVAGILLAQPAAIYAGGFIFVGCLVTAVVKSSEIIDLAHSISKTQGNIRTVTTTIEQMQEIVDAFVGLDDVYRELNGFWGGLGNDAANVKVMDDVTAMTIGAGILEDLSSMQAAMSMTETMQDACQTYLTVLNKQGISIPTDDPCITKTSSYFTSLASFPNDLQAHDTLSLSHVFNLAQAALREKDVEKYQNIMNFATLLDLEIDAADTLARLATGLWFDEPALRSSSIVWLSSSSSFSNASGIYDSAAISASETSALASKTGGLDFALNSLRPLIVQSLNEIDSMASTIVDWIAAFPNLPTNEEDKVQLGVYRTKAMVSCQTAQSDAASVNNLFADFNHRATTYQLDLGARILAKKDAIAHLDERYKSEIAHLSTPWWMVLVSPLTIGAWIASETQRIRGDWENERVSIYNQIDELQSLKDSGASFHKHVLTWIDMSQAVSENLGSIHNILVGVWGQLAEDPVFYERLIRGEWSTLSRSAKEVLAIVGNSTSELMLWSVSRHTILETVAAQGDAPTAPKKSLRVIKAVSPNAGLGKIIVDQSEGAIRFFDSLDDIFKQPDARDIVGSWDSTKTRRQTLYDVAISLRNEFASTISLEYDAVQRIQSLTTLQDFRLQNVVAGKLSLQTFVQVTLTSVKSTLEVTQKAERLFKESAKKFTIILDIIEANITSIEGQISGLNEQIGKDEKEQKEKSISVVSEMVSLAFAGVALLTSTGMPTSITAVVEMGAKLGVSANSIRTSLRAALATLSLPELAKAIQALKATKGQLDSGVKALKEIQPVFEEVVTGVTGLNGGLTTMKVALTTILRDVDLGMVTKLTEAETDGLRKAWLDLRENTQTWLDVINKQGIRD